MSMKKGAVLLLLMLMPVMALAEGPVLETSLPENAQLIESVEFEDGDFIRTYQMEDGATVQMLRYSAFDMTLDDLAEGEWTGYTAREELELSALDGYPAEGVHLMTGDVENGFDVFIVLVRVQEQTLIFQTVLGTGADLTRVQEWLSDMRVVQEDEVANG